MELTSTDLKTDRYFGEPQVSAIEVAVVIDAYGPGRLPVLIDRNKDGEFLVSIAPDDWLHGASYVRSAYPVSCASAFIGSPKEKLPLTIFV